MSNVTYPLDLTGINPDSRVIDELHTVTEAHFRDYYFIVPNFAPFYVDNFEASIIVNNTERVLVEDVDFSFALPYVTGTRVTGKALYGAITLHNLELNGVIKLSYQTLGGEHIADRLYVLSYLAEKAYNPRTTIWDLITNAPAAFPPEPHYQDYDDFYGQEEVVQKLGEIRDAIIQNALSTQQQIKDFFNNNLNLTNYVNKNGDQMLGSLLLASDPTQPLEAATKQYVDNIFTTSTIFNNILSNYVTNSTFTTEINKKVDKAGDTMTGPLTLSGDPTQNLHAATKQYVDNKINQIQTEINNLSFDSVTKTYVDSKVEELKSMIHEILIYLSEKDI